MNSVGTYLRSGLYPHELPFARSTPVGLRSAEDQLLDLLPDNDIKGAMQVKQFRYCADVEGS